MVMAGSLLCGNAAPQIDRDSASSVAETAAVASANVKQLEGAGTASNPYLIRDEEDSKLYGLRYGNKKYVDQRLL